MSDAHFKTIGRRISSSMSSPNLMFSVISITVKSPFRATYDHNDWMTYMTEWTNSFVREEFIINTSGWFDTSLRNFSHPHICSSQFWDRSKRGNVFASFSGFLKGWEGGGK